MRLENLVQPEQMPYVNVTNKHFDSGDYPASLRKALEMIDIDGVRTARPAARPTAGASAWAWPPIPSRPRTAPRYSPPRTPVIPGFDQATVRVTPDGGLEVRVGVHSHGQGMETHLRPDRP